MSKCGSGRNERRVGRWSWLLAGGILLVPALSQAQVGRGANLGVGFAFGSPTGLSLSYWVDSDIAAAATVFYEFEEEVFTGALDALYRMRNVMSLGQMIEVGLHFGAGVGLDAQLTMGNGDDEGGGGGGGGGKGKGKDEPGGGGGGEDINVKVRAIAGAAAMLRNVPLEFFVEVVPFLPVHPEVTDINFDFTVGARYYFGI